MERGVEGGGLKIFLHAHTNTVQHSVWGLVRPVSPNYQNELFQYTALWVITYFLSMLMRVSINSYCLQNSCFSYFSLLSRFFVFHFPPPPPISSCSFPPPAFVTLPQQHLAKEEYGYHLLGSI